MYNCEFLRLNGSDWVSAALDQVRQELVDKHATNVRQYEQKLRSIQQERQAVFQDAFQNDLQIYRQSGTIPSKYIRREEHKQNYCLLTV